MNIRTAVEAEVDVLARIWYDGWQEAHARILPAELARYRTLEIFRSRLQSTLQNVRVAGPSGQPLGFCINKGDEIDQLYVSASARGSGLAAALLADAEKRFSAHGIHTAWLACAIGNMRAARFYEKHGWYRVGNMIGQLTIPDGVFPLEVWRYEKALIIC